MNRRLCTTLPTTRSLCQPSIPDGRERESSEAKSEGILQRLHRATTLESLEPGSTSRVTDHKSSGVVVDQATPRSYNVVTEDLNT